MAVQPSHAVPASPRPVTVTQADGTPLTLRIIGDECDHQYFSTDGYLLINVDDIYYYAGVDDDGVPVSSGIRATEPSRRSPEAASFLNSVDKKSVSEKLNARLKKRWATNHPAKAPSKGPGLTGRSAFPAKGKQKALVILVEYTDVKFHEAEGYNPKDYFTGMMTGEGFSLFGGTGSARDFFMDSSMGQFEPEFDVYGPIALTKNRAYYGSNGLQGKDTNAYRMVIEACQQLDGTVDFTQYDRDGDGYIDNVFLFYAGEGEHMGASSDSVWPHAYNISDKDSTPYMFDGVRLDRYGCTCEWVEGRPDGVGTFVHEFSHVMGLPDLYTTNYNMASFTPGSWSTLDAGPYNNNGCTPPLYSAYERYALDWIKPVTIDGSVSAMLPSLLANMAAIIPTSDSNEFFLLENRQQTGWDKYLPCHGMLVWHVDYEKSIWFTNAVNNDENHQYVDLEEADNIKTAATRDGDAFPGTAGITAFTDDTRPSMRPWNNTPLSLPITDIAESDGMITFKVLGGSPEPLGSPVAKEPEQADHESFTALWEPARQGMEHLLSVYTVDEGGEPEYLSGYFMRNVGNATSCEIKGLAPDRTYKYTVRSVRGLEISAPSEVISIETRRMPLDRLQVLGAEATDITSDSFTARWEQLPEANDYLIEVYRKVPGGPLSDVCDFSAGIDNLPAGWVSTSPTAYSMGSYAGETTPSLRMATDGDCLTTPEYSDGIKGLSFWHRGQNTNEADRVSVSAKTADGWKELYASPIETAKGGKTTEVKEIPSGTTAMRIGFKMTGARSSLAIDDVKLLHGVKLVPQNLPAYNGEHTGDAASMKIEGLIPDTEYFYSVKATDGTLVSKASDEIAVKTTAGSGLGDMEENVITITTFGTDACVSGIPEGAIVNAFDIAGRTIASALADTRGTATLHLPAAGIYIVDISGNGLRRKIIVKQ